MLKAIGMTILSMILLFAGLYLGYLFLKNLNNGVNLLFLISAIVLTGLGIFLSIRASKSNENIVQSGKITVEAVPSENSTHKESLLERNNAITQEWFKKSEKKDKMKMLKMIANAEENPYQG